MDSRKSLLLLDENSGSTTKLSGYLLWKTAPRLEWSSFSGIALAIFFWIANLQPQWQKKAGMEGGCRRPKLKR